MICPNCGELLKKRGENLYCRFCSKYYVEDISKTMDTDYLKREVKRIENLYREGIISADEVKERFSALKRMKHPLIEVKIERTFPLREVAVALIIVIVIVILKGGYSKIFATPQYPSEKIVPEEEKSIAKNEEKSKNDESYLIGVAEAFSGTGSYICELEDLENSETYHAVTKGGNIRLDGKDKVMIFLKDRAYFCLKNERICTALEKTPETWQKLERFKEPSPYIHAKCRRGNVSDSEFLPPYMLTPLSTFLNISLNREITNKLAEFALKMPKS